MLKVALKTINQLNQPTSFYGRTKVIQESMLVSSYWLKTKDVARIMQKYWHKIFRRGVWGRSNRSTGRSLPEAHRLYNRKGDVFDHFGSAFDNIKFRLFCPFLTSGGRMDGWSRYLICERQRALYGIKCVIRIF